MIKIDFAIPKMYTNWIFNKRRDDVMKIKNDDILGTYKYFLPIAFIVFLIPLLVRFKFVLPTSIEQDSWKKMEFYSDFFAYNKAKVLIILAIVALLILAYALVLENIVLKKTAIYIPMIAYAILIILSTVFSTYTHISLYGFAERYEGMLVLLAYLALMFMAINLTSSNKTLIVLLIAFISSALIISAIGIGQYFGYDVFKSYIGKRIILPLNLDPSDVSFNITQNNGTLYSTLMNSNYMGSYMALLLPILICVIFYCQSKLYKIGFSLIFLITSATLIGSNSRAGLVAIASSALLYVILRAKNIFSTKKNIFLFILALIICCIGIFGANKATNNKLYTRVNKVFAELRTKQPITKKTKVTDISVTEDNKVKLSIDDKFLTVNIEKNALVIKDSADKALGYKLDAKGNIVFDDKDYASFKFALSYHDNKPLVQLKEGALNTGFIWTDNTIKYFNPQTLLTYNIYPVSHKWFDGYEGLGSWRGYIWSRTLPLLKHTLILGKGPDTYCIYFPQQEFIARANMGFGQNVIVDKPHNMYLGTAFNTGVLSLVAMCLIFLMYFIKSFKLYFKLPINDIYSIIGFGICLGTFGYLAAGMFNDSMVGVAPVFWILLGCGVAINMKLEKDLKSKDDLLEEI